MKSPVSPRARAAAEHLHLERFGAYLRLLAELFLDRHAQLRARVDASDIVQQTLLRAHEKRRQFRGVTEAELKGWLRKILINLVHNQVRDLLESLRREVSLDEWDQHSPGRLETWLTDKQASPSQDAERKEQQAQLARALDILPEGQRQALLLRYFRGLSLAEVSQTIGRSFTAVAGLLKRGLKSLRERLGEQD